MSIFAPRLFELMWLAWGACWWVLSWNVKPTAQREPIVRRLGHIVPLALAAVLLTLPQLPPPLAILDARFVGPGGWTFWAGAGLTAAGLLFAVWARLHIGTNWSGIVTIKQGHELVVSGPYAIVRHPIYSGLSLAFAGSALARGGWGGVLAVGLVLTSFWFKLRFEERWMRRHFGDAYAAYSRRVAALIPWVL